MFNGRQVNSTQQQARMARTPANAAGSSALRSGTPAVTRSDSLVSPLYAPEHSRFATCSRR